MDISRTSLPSLPAGMLAALFLLGATASAQEPSHANLEEGDRVRITAPEHGLERSVGTIRAASEHALTVLFQQGYPVRTIDSADVIFQGGYPVSTIARADIVTMELSTGQRGRAMRGMGIGALAGFGAGFVLGLVSGDDEESCSYTGPDRVQICFARAIFTYSAEQNAMMYGVGLGVVGGLVGLIVGAIHPAEIWTPVTPEGSEISVRPAVSARGPGVQVRLTVP